MAFDAITTAELAVGKPITNELMEKFRNRDEFLNGQIGSLQSFQILNNSFEINDTSVTGGAANWTVTLLPGGAATISTAFAMSGAQSLTMIHPGGAGNGGAEGESDFYPVSTGLEYVCSFSRKSTGFQEDKVQLRYFKIDQSTLSVSTIYRSTTPQSFFSTHTTFIAPTSARYLKVGLIGGSTAESTGGAVYWDDIEIKRQPDDQTINQNALKTATGIVTKAAPSGASTYGSVTLADYTFMFNGYTQDSTTTPPTEHIVFSHNSSNDDTIPRCWLVDLTTATGDGFIRYRYITASQGFKGAIFHDSSGNEMGKHTLSNAPENYKAIFDDMAKTNGWTWEPTTVRST